MNSLIVATMIVLAVVGVLAWFFLSPAGPAIERHRSLDRVRELTPRLSMMSRGATLWVQRDADGRDFRFQKEEDTGLSEQKIRFILSEESWSTRTFGAVELLLRNTPLATSVEVGGTAPQRVLACTLAGKPPAMEFLAGELIARIRPALDLDDQDRFRLTLRGAMDYAIWRRVNEASLQSMARHNRSSLLRRFGRYQLRKHTGERSAREDREG